MRLSFSSIVAMDLFSNSVPRHSSLRILLHRSWAVGYRSLTGSWWVLLFLAVLHSCKCIEIPLTIMRTTCYDQRNIQILALPTDSAPTARKKTCKSPRDWVFTLKNGCKLKLWTLWCVSFISFWLDIVDMRDVSKYYVTHASTTISWLTKSEKTTPWNLLLVKQPYLCCKPP